MAWAGAIEPMLARKAGRIGRSLAYRAQLSGDYAEVAACWEGMAARGAALPFQRKSWLAAWFGAHRGAGCQPLLVTVFDGESGEPVMGLPLVLSRADGRRTITFADYGLTDYNAPVLGVSAPDDAARARHMLRAIRAVLPPADVLRFDKMPRMVGALPNPLALLPGVATSNLNGNILHVPGAWEDWHYGLERTFRKELERSLRVFLKQPGAQVRQITEPEDVARVYSALKLQQRERIAELGLPYILDQREPSQFYDRLVADGIQDGSVILTALTAGEEVVAALLGIRDGQHYAMVRLSTAGTAWKNCSPGRLLIERTMHMLHAQGYRRFDFTIGDYAYKRRMGVTASPLCELTLALSWRGWPPAILARAKALAKRVLRRPGKAR